MSNQSDTKVVKVAIVVNNLLMQQHFTANIQQLSMQDNICLLTQNPTSLLNGV